MDDSSMEEHLMPPIEEILTAPHLLELDTKTWAEKYEYAALLAQPILDRELPARFPSASVRSLGAAAARVRGAAKLMLSLCGFGAASEDMMLLLETGSEGDLMATEEGPQRRVEDIVEWRDIWTHPEFYRRVYADWLGEVYRSRSGALEEASDQAQRASFAWPEAPRGAYWTNDYRGARRGGPPGAPAGTLGPYQHPAPERFGHPTSLVHVTETPSGSARQAMLRRQGASYAPSAVVRLSSVEWYLKGFLPSVLLWTHLALVEAPRVAQHYLEAPPGLPLHLNLSLYDLVAAASSNRIVGGGQEECVKFGRELKACWRQLESLLEYVREDWLSHEYSRITVLTPSLHPDEPQSTTLVPDMIRVPQELWGALAKNRGGVDDAVRLHGVDGGKRWINIERFSEDTQWEYATLPDWVYSVEDAGKPRAALHGEEDERTVMLQNHRTRLDAAIRTTTQRAFPAMGGLIGTISNTKRMVVVTRYLSNLEDAHRSMLNEPMPPPERYLPLPDPPHPVPALYIPWTFTATLADPRGSGRRGGFESVLAPEGVRTLDLRYVGVPCLETGLAIEEWGSCWNRLQRAARAHPPTHHEIVAAVRGGQSVRGVDVDFPMDGGLEGGLMSLRELRLTGVFVLDPDGPMGRGHRIYSVDNPLEASDPARPNWPRDWRRAPEASWLRLDRIRTAEYLSVTPAPVDEVGRWEDSGLEVPAEIVRDPQRHRPLRFCKIDHVATPDSAVVMREYESNLRVWAPGTFITAALLWEQTHWQLESRIWVPRRIDPWPPYATLHKLDVSRLDTAPIARAPVIRHFALRHVSFPRPMWARELFEYPPGAPGAGVDMPPDRWMRFLDTHRAPMSLMPTARATLLALSIEEVQRYGKAPELLGPSVPDAEDFGRAVVVNLLPGVPLPARHAIADREAGATTRFRHYPNLTALGLENANLVDLPWGLLDLWMSGTYHMPLPEAVGRARGEGVGARINPPPHRRLLVNLATNRIRGFSTVTWTSLALLVKTRYDRAVRMRGMRKDEASRYMQYILVNLAGNPIVDRVMGAAHADRDAPFVEKWRGYAAAQLDGIAHRYRREIEAAPRSGEVPSPAVMAMKFWKSHRATVLMYLCEMFILEQPRHFAQHMIEHFRQLHTLRNLWMI